jgi:hypothetical protein
MKARVNATFFKKGIHGPIPVRREPRVIHSLVDELSNDALFIRLSA